MRTRSDIAISYFNGGCNCAQAVLSALKDYTGLDVQTSQNIAAGFGGGIGNANSICGAVSGAIMALGAWKGHYSGATKSSTFYREKFLNELKQYTPQFTCKGILNHRPSFINNQSRVCIGAVSRSVEIFEEIVKE